MSDSPEVFAQPRVTDVVALMRHALKSASYKPALLKALVRVCAREPGPEISLHSIGREFTRLYWNQTVVYHLRQAATLSKESTAVKLVRATAEEYRVRKLDELPENARNMLDGRMARLLTVNALAAFHASRPTGMLPLYQWLAGSETLTLSRGVSAFLRQYASTLELVANYYWAEFLENTNRLAPKILKKVATDAMARSSLAKYLAILSDESERSCFYCHRPFDAGRPATVDHVIPWSFLLEDALWDLVLACRQCNGAKSDWLPAPALLTALLDRNRARREVLNGQVSLFIADGEIERLYQAALSVEWPHFWSPAA